MTLSAEPKNFTTTTFFPTYEAFWGQCQEKNESNRFCWSRLTNYRDYYLTKCIDAFGDIPACRESLKRDIVRGFMPPYPTDEEQWAICRENRSRKKCTQDLESSHAKYLDLCRNVSYLNANECDRRLTQLVICEFKPN